MMKIDTSEHVERFKELPRIWQWITASVVFLLAFLIWAELIEPMSTGWAERADRMELDLERTSEAIILDPKSKNAAMTYGEVVLPDLKPQGSLAVTEIVQTILSSHGITNDTFFQSQSSNIKKSVLPGIARGGEKIERIKGELDFMAPPQTAIAVISDIERHPGIEAISNVKIDKSGDGQVRTRLTMEAWVRSR